jgi:Domain of unknown function (DUF1844)
MPEKPPTFTVTDRRKFTLDGELRDESTPSAADETKSSPAPVPPTPAPQASTPSEAPPGPRLVTKAEAAPPLPVEKLEQPESAQPEEDDDLLPEPTAEETAEQHTAYQQSSRQLDDLLRQSNPELGSSAAAAAVTIDHVIQSIYLSAVVAMGAAAEPGQKPRIDIIGARQSIDMLSVLQEKTKGNLTDNEQRLLQNILFELRMMFLEITNAISQQAQRPPLGKK